MSRLRVDELQNTSNTALVEVEDLAPLPSQVSTNTADIATLNTFKNNLSGPNGAANIFTTNPSTGSVSRSVTSKLSDIVSRSDFSSDVNFNTAAVGKPNIDGSAVFRAPVRVTGSNTTQDLSDALMSVAYGPRDVVVYGSATTAKMSRRFATMGGFRFMGQYIRGRAPVFPVNNRTASLTGSGLGAQSSNTKENWYAGFACANNGDSEAVIKTMPFLRVGSVAGNVITLNKAGEGIHSVTAQTYSWTATNNLAGVECLVISENGLWSGRVTTITANTGTTVTLADVGTLAFGDFILPAPPSFANYCYLGSFYLDTAEVRNIYDTGHMCKSKGIYILSPAIEGSQTNVKMEARGYISPLATGIIIRSAANLSTTSAGNVAEYFSPDSNNHTVASTYYVKQVTTSVAYEFDQIEIPFLYPQSFYYTNDGTLSANRVSGRLHVTGWYEP